MTIQDRIRQQIIVYEAVEAKAKEEMLNAEVKKDLLTYQFHYGEKLLAFAVQRTLQNLLSECSSVAEEIPVCECDKVGYIYSDNGIRIRCCKCGGLVKRTG